MGTRQFGKYALRRRLAVGGMAEIFLAQVQGIEGFTKPIVLKRILPHLIAEPDFLSMFVDEAKLAASLTHPNIVQVYELGSVEGRYFIAMEFVDGVDLSTLCRTLWERGEHLPFSIAVYIASETARGLHYAHEKRDGTRPLGIVHRDVSPHNVLLSHEGVVKVTDFGIAKAEGRSTKTKSGVLKGKFSYMAPEQAFGRPTDRRADLFALGLVVYELFAGRRAYVAENELVMLELARSAQVDRLETVRPQIPRPVARVIHKALAENPDDRYATCHEFAQALVRAAIGWVEPASSDELAALVRVCMQRPTVEDAVFGDEELLDADLSQTEPLSDVVMLDNLRRAAMRSSVGIPASSLPSKRISAVAEMGLDEPTAKMRRRSNKALLLPLLFLALLAGGGLWAQRSGLLSHDAGPNDTQAMVEAPPASSDATQSSVSPNNESTEPPPTASEAKTEAKPETKPGPPTPANTKAEPTAHGSTEPPANEGRTRTPADSRSKRRREEPRFGYLTINSQPWSYVFVDGKKQSKTTPLQQLKLPAGRYRIRLDSPGAQKSNEFTVDIKPGKTVTKIVSFAD